MVENLFNITQDILKRVEVAGKSHSLKNILLDEMKNFYGEQSAETLNQIKTFFDQTDNNHREIAEGKLEGRSTESWLKEKLSTKEKEFPGLIKGILTTIQSLSDEDEIQEHANLDETNAFDFGILVRYFTQKIKNSSLAEFVLANESVINSAKTSVLTLLDGFDQLTDALKSDLNSPEDSEFKELLTVSTLKFIDGAEDSSLFKNFDHLQVMTVIDMVYTSVKVAYKVADKSISGEEAIDFLIDRGIARISSFIQSSCSKMSGNIGSQVGRAVGAVFGPVGSSLGSIVGQNLGKMMGQKGGQILSEGMNKLLPTIKNSLQAITNQAIVKIIQSSTNLLSKF